MATALSLTSLRKTYRNGFEALKGVDLTVNEGDFFALLGPNGAGKSTTIGIIASLVTKSDGKVEIFGADLDREKELAKSYLGLVPQEFNFNQFEPVGEIVVNQAGYYGLSRAIAWKRAEAVLTQLRLWERRRDQARDLSGGMKRRLMIARALVHEPKLLILDEPTAGVDIEIRRSMWEFLRRINAQGTTIILTTHYLEEAESLCRSIAIIDQGRLIENTRMKDLLAQLRSETFVLNLRRPLTTLPTAPGYVLEQIDDTTLEAQVVQEQGINGLFQELGSHGVEVMSLRNKTNRLEELFMRLVGRKPD